MPLPLPGLTFLSHLLILSDGNVPAPGLLDHPGEAVEFALPHLFEEEELGGTQGAEHTQPGASVPRLQRFSCTSAPQCPRVLPKAMLGCTQHPPGMQGWGRGAELGHLPIRGS